MSSSLGTTATNIYLTGLRNQHAVENQAIELLERQVGRLEQSREQASRLGELLGQHDADRSMVKDVLMSVVGNLAALVHGAATDEVVKSTLANFAFENFEIASYKSLLCLADLAGQSGARSALETSLREEQDMAAWIEEHMDSTVRRYVERSASSLTAGV